MEVSELTEIRDKIYNFLDEKLVDDGTLVTDAARYAVLNDASHFWRPLIVMEVARSYAVDYEFSIPYATAIELIHNATLIMDDLPSMDDSPMRRGKESVWKKYDVAIAGLCIVELISNAISLANSGAVRAGLERKVNREVALASKRLIDGQENDLFESENVPLERIYLFYQQKSGSLYESSAVIGGMLGNASKKDQEFLRVFGMNIGIAYQLGDDLFDHLGESEVLGKPVGQDKRKKTPIDYLGIERTQELRKSFEEKGVESLRKIDRDFSRVTDLASMITGTHKNMRLIRV